MGHDDLTNAVRRLKALREDVERLKADRDEEGEVRLVRVVNERATTSDVVAANRDNDDISKYRNNKATYRFCGYRPPEPVTV